jgi:ABC-2 type transport system ATP-binding protein
MSLMGVARLAEPRQGCPAAAGQFLVDRASNGRHDWGTRVFVQCFLSPDFAEDRSSMSKPVMIEADGLSKQFGSYLAVRDVTFSIPKGEVVAFLGPNGAGKTTTMRLLTGFVAPTHGTAKIAGIDVQTDRIKAAEHLGYLPENGPLYPDMSPTSLLRFFGEARGISAGRLHERIDAVVGQCALETVAHKPIGKLSKGYRQRVSMAQALLHDPEVLIMDEPTSGLDPNQIRVVRQLIRDLGQSKTVMVSTHILQEVEPVADRVLFIHDGKIVFDGKPAELASQNGNLEQAFYGLTAQPV